MITQPPLIAGGTIRRARFIKVSTAADHTALEAGANERVCGVTADWAHDAPIDGSDINHALAGDNLTFYGVGETCIVTVGSGGITRGDLLFSDAYGNAVTGITAAAGRWISGEALESAAAGELAEIIVRQTYYPLSA